MTRPRITFPRRPGPGWKRYPMAPVWEHSSGMRIHSAGLIILPDGQKHWAAHFLDLHQAVAQQGGRRRGLMVYALRLLKTSTPAKL